MMVSSIFSQQDSTPIKISVITVCKNAENTIEETLKSVFKQTYPNIEYIVKDGVSTDSTLNIVKKYERSISKIISGQDKSIYDAMNIAIRYASGDYVFFLNADDQFFSSNTIRTVVGALQKTNADIIYGDLIIMHNQRFWRYYSNDQPLSRLRVSIFSLVHQSVFKKRELFNILGTYNYQEFAVCANWNWVCKAYENEFKFQYLSIPICKFSTGGFHSRADYRHERKRIYNRYLLAHDKLIAPFYYAFHRLRHKIKVKPFKITKSEIKHDIKRTLDLISFNF
jgi:glycosyltransferase involved in cell wall biosynthesis